MYRSVSVRRWSEGTGFRGSGEDGAHGITNCSRTHRPPGTKRITVVCSQVIILNYYFRTLLMHAIRLCLHTCTPTARSLGQRGKSNAAAAGHRLAECGTPSGLKEPKSIIKHGTVSRVRPTLTRFNALPIVRRVYLYGKWGLR